MNYELVLNEFKVRYYKWRLQEARQEYESSFERLSMMNNFFARQTIEAIQTLPKEEQPYVLSILIKHSERNSLKILGDNITDEEEKLLESFNVIRNDSQLIKKLNEREKLFKKIPKRHLKKEIKEALNETLLKPDFYANIWFDTKIDENWKIKTFIEIEDGYSYYYSHSIYWFDKSQNKEFSVGSPIINLAGWLGVYSGGWVFLNDENVHQTAKMIAYLCKYFIEALAEILNEITKIGE